MNSPTFTLKLNSDTFTIIAFHIRLEVNHDYTATVHILTKNRLPNIVEQGAVIYSELNGEVNQLVNGIVVGMDSGQPTGDGFHYELTLRSLLVYLEMAKHNRVFVQETVPDILPFVFKGGKVNKSDYKLNSKQIFKPHPQIVQYQESDLDFFHTILGYEGLQYTAGSGTPSVQIFDHLQQLPTSSLLTLPSCKPDGRPSGDAAFWVHPKQICLPTQVTYRAHNFQDPSNTLEVTALRKSKIPGRGSIYAADLCYFTESEGQALVDRHMAVIDAQREVIDLVTNCIDVSLGQLISISGYPHSRDFQKNTLRAVAIEHYYHNEGLLPERVKLTDYHTKYAGYHNCITTIDAEHRYYAMTEVPLRYHGLVQAKIESTGGINDQLDSQGRYTVKFVFDENVHAKGAASTPMPAAQISAGPNSGLHSPFVPGADVLVQCINGDLRQCVILGSLPTENSPSPVSHVNPQHHVWQTPNGQSLLLNDTADARALSLSTAQQQNSMEMTDNGTTLSTLQGDMNLTAGQDYHQHVKENLNANIGNNHTQQVQGDYHLSTNEGNITHSSGRDFKQLSEGAITLSAEQNIESHAGNDMTTVAKNNILLQTHEGDFTLQTGKESIKIHGAKSIRLISKKGILIEQAGGKLEFDEQGNLSIQGNQIDLNYQNINFAGNQVKMMQGGQAAEKPKVPEFKKLEKLNAANILYITSEKAYYVLAEHDMEALEKAAEPLMDALKELWTNTNQFVDVTKQEMIQARDKAIVKAKTKLNELLKPLITDADNIHISELTNIFDGTHIYIDMKKVLPAWKAHKLTPDNEHHISYSQVKEKLKDVVKVEKDITLTEVEWDAAYKTFSKTITGKNFNATAEAQLLRATAGGSVTGNWDILNGKIGLSADGTATASLAKGKLSFNLYIPAKCGLELAVSLPGKSGEFREISLGAIRCALNLEATGFVGASVAGSANLNLDLTKDNHKTALKAYGSHKANPNTKYKSDQDKSKADNNALKTSADAFAGVKGGGNVGSNISWQNPEKQSTKKSDESWSEFAALNAEGSASLGLGAGLGFSIGFMPRSGQFYVNAHANLTCGPGASGDIGFVIEAGHLMEFVQFAYHKIKDCNFKYLGMFIEDSFARLVQIMTKYIMEQATDLKNVTEREIQRVADWWTQIKMGLNERYEQERIAARTAENILRDPEKLKFTVPEVKARLLIILGDNAWDNSNVQIAKLVVLSYLQSQEDYINVLQHLTLKDGERISSAEGFEKLKDILGITDFGAMRIMKGFKLESLPSSKQLPTNAESHSPVKPLATIEEIRAAYYQSALSLMPMSFIEWEG
jgi:Rhs element Vgr protein